MFARDAVALDCSVLSCVVGKDLQADQLSAPSPLLGLQSKWLLWQPKLHWTLAKVLLGGAGLEDYGGLGHTVLAGFAQVCCGRGTETALENSRHRLEEGNPQESMVAECVVLARSVRVHCTRGTAAPQEAGVAGGGLAEDHGSGACGSSKVFNGLL